MSFVDRHTILGIRCDARNCDDQITGEEMSLFAGMTHYEQLAESRGWTFWVGRSRRVYCPQHRPSRGSKAWQARARGER